MSNNSTAIEVRSDGVYITIDYSAANVKNEILRLVKRYQVKEVDFEAIDKAILQKLPETKISDVTQIDSKNEKMDISISEDKMSASVTFVEPIHKGKYLKAQEMKDLLSASGIRFGIDEELLKELEKKKVYGKWYKVANGEPPAEGENGFIEYFFTTKKKKLKPKELDNGYVDYRNVDYFETAKDGTVLAIAHPAVPGKDGMNVLGKVNAAQKTKPAPRLPKGKNTKVLEDGITLVAEISGRILYLDGRVSILPVLEISGDVGNETGNIDFIGSVIVKGNVISGFSITAGGDIEIEGSVEDNVRIKSGGNVMLMKGVHGGGKTKVRAGIDINANFIESSDLEAGGNITANSIIHSNVKCGETLSLIGKKGLLVGGKIVVGTKIEAKVIGSVMETVTDIEVGISPEVLEEYRNKAFELEQTSESFEKTEKIVDALSKVDVNELPIEKKKILMDSIRSKIVFKTKIKELQARLDELQPLLNRKGGRIDVSQVIYSGVKVMINNTVMYVRDKIDCCSLYSDGGRVRIGTHI